MFTGRLSQIQFCRKGKFEREIAGENQFGHVFLKLEPLARGTGIQFHNNLQEDLLSPDYSDAVEVGVREATLSGVVSGYPMVDIQVTLEDARFREGVSSELAYKIAGATAFRDGCQKAHPVLLEPIMAIEVVVPNEFVGEVIGNLNARGGKVDMIDAKGMISLIDAKVPLKPMFGYTTSLRSLTQGRGSFSMHFSHYDRAD